MKRYSGAASGVERRRIDTAVTIQSVVLQSVGGFSASLGLSKVCLVVTILSVAEDFDIHIMSQNQGHLFEQSAVVMSRY
jgi:hypothetical protein